ncbi:ABC transporter ATP-binding protein [Mangrovibrevibacter kandeliae]|uniref:ABC transporter ATP-binding protein n=1 Tax=Mangrovibrevibacter kandeliae TaxID=2968473 RepID=UPI00211830C1|nr:oligopeptide/dipeptide ABC transporter ATP-binding protein [Aurantimonas sp. CSK15Z-1]MCQ8781450.1 ATP-binding cassette domain-containing protein [Aurantimonas sp. CSK15Z-1]
MSAAKEPLPLLQIEEAVKRFPMPQGILDRLAGRPPRAVNALNGVNLAVRRGETVGIVGESGCGKSTLARCLVRLHELDDGRIRFDGKDVAEYRGAERRAFNRRVQMIFQDPYSSLNPRMRVRQILGEALSVHRVRPPAEIPGRIAELLELVRLPQDAADRFPHEFSGGQRQRIGIARALAVEPDVLVADELVSALDVSVQAQVVNLLLQLQEELHLTVVFVAHDLRLVRHISHRVAVMYLGKVIEVGPTEALFTAPRHPYTKALLDAAPELDPTRRTRVAAARGELPSPLDLPQGCLFNTRCPHAFDRCFAERPILTPRGPEHRAACHLTDFGLPQADPASVAAVAAPAPLSL